MARDFFAIEVNALLRDRPQIIGHFDLLRKYAARLSLFDEADPAYRRLALSALEQAFPCGGVLEINTGGMARGISVHALSHAGTAVRLARAGREHYPHL